MSRRFVVPAALLAAAAMPVAGAQAANHHKTTTHKHSGHNGQKISINATPDPLLVPGDEVTISGHLSAPHPANRLVVLYHRIAGQPRFTVIQTGRTDASGNYTFHRADGIVLTNRNWYVRSAGGTRSGTVHELVESSVTVNPLPPTPIITGHKVTITGKVTPGRVHAGDRVLLQRQFSNTGDDYKTIGSGRVGRDGNYTIVHRFIEDGASASLRVVLPRDKYNLRGESSPFDVVIEQAQHPKFTISASPADAISEGSSVTLTGTLAAPNNANQVVTLIGRDAAGKDVAGAAQTDANGNYTFTVSPVFNTVYHVQSNGRQSARLFVGVRDVLSNVTASQSTAKVGDVVTFTGTVLPNKTDHVVFLQRLGKDGDFHTVEVREVKAGSQFSIPHKISTTGTKVFRVVVPGGAYNLGGTSGPITVTVS